MTGDLTDFISRLQAVLPKRWFADQSPIIEALLNSIATPWVWLYGMITYVIMQTRLTSATNEWLDLMAFDYFGYTLIRKADEADPSYRNRIQMALLREAATRTAVSSGLEGLVGTQPVIFEPANCGDTGSYGALLENPASVGDTGLAYGQAGGWGSLDLPLQCFITVIRPPTPGVAMLAGYSTTNGGYGEGVISYIDLSQLPGQVTDEDIQGTLCGLLPINTVAWLQIN